MQGEKTDRGMGIVIMDKSINILDKDYAVWVKELVKRYRGSQIKAAVKVNNEMLRYYWELGKDIEEKQVDNKYGSRFYATLSRDLRHEMPDVEGLSETSIRYAKRFYVLYSQQIAILPQLVEESEKANLPQLVERLYTELCMEEMKKQPKKSIRFFNYYEQNGNLIEV